jgi:hypothetical protein
MNAELKVGHAFGQRYDGGDPAIYSTTPNFPSGWSVSAGCDLAGNPKSSFSGLSHSTHAPASDCEPKLAFPEW